MNALPIGVALDVSEQIASRLVLGRLRSLMDELNLEGEKEALHRSIVVAAAV